MTALWTPPTLTGLTPGPVTLTRRRAEVLDRVCLGESNAAIAAELFVTVDTVKTHVRRLYTELGATNRAHAVAIVCSGQVAIKIGGKSYERMTYEPVIHASVWENRRSPEGAVNTRRAAWHHPVRTTGGRAPVSSILPPAPDNNHASRDIHDAAIIAVQIACDHHRASDRTRRYFLRRALAHGVTIDELCTVAGIDRDAVLELTDPAAG